MKGIAYTTLAAAFSQYNRRLVDYARRYVGSVEEAKDIVQDCFVKLWQQRTVYSEDQLSALLFTMVKNSCLDYLKHKCVITKFSAEYLQTHAEEERLFNLDFLGHQEGEDLYTLLYKGVRNALETLPQRRRQVFELCHFEGMSNKEIAINLNISEAAVSKHLSHAHEMLGKILTKN